jgi:hypothetical protein
MVCFHIEIMSSVSLFLLFHFIQPLSSYCPSGERVLVLVDVVCVCVCVYDVYVLCVFLLGLLVLVQIMLFYNDAGRIYVFICVVRNQMTRHRERERDTIYMFLLFLLCYDFYLGFNDDKLCCVVVAERCFFFMCMCLRIPNRQ